MAAPCAAIPFFQPNPKGDQNVDVSMQPDPFADIQIPEQLWESIERHRKNLARLVENLRTAGLSESQIETSVSVMVDSYKQELLRAIKAMVN